MTGHPAHRLHDVRGGPRRGVWSVEVAMAGGAEERTHPARYRRPVSDVGMPGDHEALVSLRVQDEHRVVVLDVVGQGATGQPVVVRRPVR